MSDDEADGHQTKIHLHKVLCQQSYLFIVVKIMFYGGVFI